MPDSPELATRYYIGHCPDDDTDLEPSSLQVTLTEKLPGQFADKPYEPFRVNCWFGLHEDGHMLYPCGPEGLESDND